MSLFFIGMLVALQIADNPAGPVSFKDQVAPILVRRCLGCHNAQEAKSGLNLSTFARLKQGGKTSGPDILAPGDPDASALIESIRPDASPRMPYKQPPLGDSEIATLERWVKDGAKFDGPSEDTTPIASLVDPLEGLPRVTVKVPTSEPIAALVYSPDGTRLAAGHGREVLVFDVIAGKLAFTLSEHPGPIAALRFTPDGATLVAAGGRPGQFGTITVWDLVTKARRHDLRGHGDSILGTALSPDGRTLATASYDRLVKLWDIIDGKEIRTLKEHTDAVYAVAFSPDGRSLASAGADRTAKVWDVGTGRKRVTLSDATAELYAIRFAPDGKTVLAAGVDRTIRSWIVDGDMAAVGRSTIAHDGAILRLVVAPDGKTLYSSGEDKAVKVWDLATLEPRSAVPAQPEWPLDIAVSPDGSRLAVGLYDGSLAVLDPRDGKLRASLREAPGATPRPEPKLVANATLNPPSPRGALRGTKVRMQLSGHGIEQAHAVVFSEPGINAAIVPTDKPTPAALAVDLEIAADARVGVHRFWVQTPLGVPTAQSFVVSAYPESSLIEPDDDPLRARTISLPAIMLGTIEKPGDVDHARFEAKAGQTVVFETLARQVGSGLDGSLAVLDEAGHVLAEGHDSETGLDPLLIFTAPRAGSYTLRIVDADYGGSGNHFYRISAGALARVESVFPLGAEAGKKVHIDVTGVNLGEVNAISYVPPPGAAPGTVLSVPIVLPDGSRPINARQIVAAEGPQHVESEGNDDVAHANTVATPGGVSGRIDRDGDADHFRFEAKKGQRLVLESFGRRLGTSLDSSLHVLDLQGRPVPRAVVRPVAESEVAFRDHPSTGRNIRMTKWNDFAEGDYVLIGREVLRLAELPRNPDDDAVFWGLGYPRINSGERVAFLGTTPEHHAQAQPIYKVEVHPPGTTFPPGGTPPVTMMYRNDDGGPGFGKDSWLVFDPPADGSYVVRVEDVRGLGGPHYGYHLVVRRPRPDFQVNLSAENPNVPRGGTTVLTASITRRDGYQGPVDVSLENLPPGIAATPARIEPDVYAADLVVMADPAAQAFSSPTFALRARAPIRSEPDSSTDVVEHTLDPGGPRGGWITVTPDPNLVIKAEPQEVAIHPGERIEMSFAVDRNPAYKGRVPIDVRNLPRGVQVLNIGLNGVLVTEKQTQRSVFLHAEPWVAPMELWFYAVGKCEAAGTEHSSRPIRLIVKPREVPVAANRLR
jgi:WD40 repeat protein